MANALGELFGDIASAIREKTGDAEKMKPAQFPEKISEIETGADVSGVTATAEDVLNGKKFVDARGNVIDGTMPNLGSKIIWWRTRPIRNPEAINQGGIAILEIEEGYHDGTSGIQLTFEYPKRYTPTKERKMFSSSYSTGMFLGDIDIDPIPDQYQDVTPVTATAEDVRAGKVFVDAEGNAVEGALSGTIADVSGVTATAADVRQGKVIVDAQGNEVVGTLEVQQKAPDVIWVGKDSVSNAQVGTGVVRYVTFMNDDGTAVYGQKSVLVGTDCIEPVAGGYMDAPTKESTAEHTFTFSGGWATEPNGGKDSNALKNVTEDRTVYANFIAAVRYYTVRFYDDNGTTVLTTQSIAYGAKPSYTPTKTGYKFTGWVPEITEVTGEQSYTATWAAVEKLADYTWAQLAAMSAEEAREKFSVGDSKGNNVLVGFEHDDLADGSGKAKMSFISHAVSTSSQYNNINSYFSENHASLSHVKKFPTKYFPDYDELQPHIKAVKKKCVVSGSMSSGNAVIGTVDTSLWTPSASELGYIVNTSTVPDEGERYEFFNPVSYGSKISYPGAKDYNCFRLGERWTRTTTAHTGSWYLNYGTPAGWNSGVWLISFVGFCI